MAWKFARLTLAAVLVGGVFSLWFGRQEVVRLAGTRLLTRQGMGPVQLTIGRVGLFGLQAYDISLYGGAIRADVLVLAYDPVRLAAGIVDKADLTGLRVTMALKDSGIVVGGAPLRFAAADAPATPGYRIDALRITDAHVAFEQPDGRVEATFSTDLAVSGASIPKASFAVDLAIPLAGTVHAMRIAVPLLELSAADGGGLRLRFQKVEVRPKDLPWVVDDLGGELLWRGGDQLSVSIGAARVSDGRTPAAIVPVGITGEITLAGSRLDFTLHAEGEAAGRRGKFVLDATGQHDRATGTGHTTITTTPVVFRANGLQPRDLFPATGTALGGLAGSVALSGGIGWRNTTITPALILRLADIVLEPQGMQLSKIHGDIKLVGLAPLATAPGQVLSGIVGVAGMPPANATLTFQLLPAPALRIQAMRMDLAGGELSVSPFVIDLVQPGMRTVVGLRQIDITEVFTLVGVAGLAGTGRIDGSIPMTVSGGRVQVRDGRLAASGPGVLRLRSDTLPKQVTDAGESMALVLRALEDFHYDTLEIELDGSPSGDGAITLRIKGRNPAVLEGHPFNLNIRFESNFDQLVALALRSMTAARALLRQTAGSTRQ